ncbi:MAG: protein kinase [Gemmatimonadaceae bacterium]
MTEGALHESSGAGGGGWPHELDEEYECLGELGRGGMAVVYRARERALGRDVAIKVVRPRFHTDQESVARLAREARTVAQLEHPNIVSLHAVKRLDNGLALVMQLVPGTTLKTALARGPMAPTEAEHVLRDIARALSYAHRCGVVHRDVKPENIFLDEITGRALLSDFGVARSIEENTELTATGTAIGTPTYMSPEQIDGGHLDGRSDLYALGMVGWEMLSGQRPWAGESLYSVIYRQKHDPLPPLDQIRSDIPPKLQYLIEGLMHKNPDRRWSSSARFLTFLTNNDAVPGLKEWQAAVKKRRKNGGIRSVTASRAPAMSPPANPALSTVRFRRGDTPHGTEVGGSPDELQAIAIDNTDETQRLTSGSWGMTDFAPPDEPPVVAPARRFAWPIGTAVVLAAVVVLAFMFRPRPPQPATFSDSTRLADAAGVEVPVRAPGDSMFLGVAPLDTLSMASSGALGLADSSDLRGAVTNVDSLRALAANELADRRPAAATRFPPSPGATLGVRPAPPAPGGESATVAARAAAARDSVARAGSTPSVTVSFSADRGNIAAGGRHSCMLDDGGKVACWGNNERGQLGDGTFEPRAAPGNIVGEFSLVTLSAGVWHSCGVSREGDAFCWGSNDAGQLGDGTTSLRSAPVRVSGNVSFRFVRAGSSHSCALSRGGSVFCWGSNALGQLGDGSRTTRTTPVLVSLGMGAGAVTVGRSHSCALTLDGAAWCWGQNDGGQLGDGSTNARIAPAAVATDQRFVSISAGNAHTCAVSTTGTVWCWGRNNYGQLGVSSGEVVASPQAVESSVSFATVTAGQVHTCARTRDGRAYCWGRNSYGQLGDGTTTDRTRPVSVRGGASFSSLNASGAHTCGITAGGEGFCWGYNIDGQLGAGDRENYSAPARVTGVSR